MATLWERLTGIGLADPGELIDLHLFSTALLLAGWGTITTQQAKSLLSLTTEQGDELDAAGSGGSRPEDVLVWVQRFRYTVEGARLGIPALDSVSNVQQALGLV